MELFDLVGDLYSTPILPKDPLSRPDDLITDAFVISREAVPVSRSAGSRQSISNHFNAGNIEEENEATLVPVFEEYSLSWQNAFRKACTMVEPAPVKPLRIVKKAKRLEKGLDAVEVTEVKMEQVERNNVMIGRVKSFTVGSSITEASMVEESLVACVCEVMELQTIDTPAGLVNPGDYPVEVGLNLDKRNSIADTTQILELSAVPDLYVNAYEDSTKVIVKTPGRKSRREGLNRDLLYAYHTFRAPQSLSNQEPETTRLPLDSASCLAPAPVVEEEVDGSVDMLTQPPANEALISAFQLNDRDDDDNSDYSVDHFDAESDPFEYDYILKESSQALSAQLGQFDSQQEQANTQPPVESTSVSGATTDSCLSPASTSKSSAVQDKNSDQVQRHAALINALLDGSGEDGHSFEYGANFFNAEADPFEYDLTASRSSQVLSNLTELDEEDEEEDDDSYGSDPFKYDCLLDSASSSAEVSSPEPELEFDSVVSSPESTPPMTPTSMDLLLSALPLAEVADKTPESHGPDVYWTWNAVNKADDDRDGAIGTAL
ncbi:hypothetical protein FRC07_012959 [Ceratobasidium sp. 392]|nr:hypothetical protein FRC07_012959 [Ceratobasidium sp. 392]